MHRTTWYAIPIVGLVVLSSGLGIWSYHLNADKQALVAQSDAEYSAAFHGLVSDMSSLRQRLGESEVSGDTTGFQACSRDIWRLCYGAQNEMAKLPVELTPMHNTQAFLSSLANQSQSWLTDNVSPTDPKVLKQVDSYYNQATKLNSQLQSIQAKVLNGGLGWVAVNRAVNQKNGYHTGDNQIVDGFQTMDKGLGTFTEAAGVGSHVEGTKSTMKPYQGKTITPTAAIQKVASMLNVTKTSDWKTSTSSLGAQGPAYMISGSTPYGSMTAVVTRAGGRVLSIHRDAQVANDHFGFATAQSKAADWLKQQGFGACSPEIANEYQNVGYFVFVPMTKNGLAVSSPISVNMGLDNGELLSFDTQAYYRNPVPTVAPARKYSAATLRTKLNPQFVVEQSRDVVLKTSSGQVHSAVQFIGSHGGSTYSVVLDATTGKQLSATQLSYS